MERLSPLLDLFFMVSGCLIWVHYADRLNGWASFKQFIIRRISRIYPLHLVTLSFFCVIALAIHFGFVTTEEPERFTLTELVKELLLINAWGTGDVLAYNYVSWSLSAEWFAYLAFPILVIVYRRFGLFGLLFQLLFTVAFLEGATAFGLMPFPTWLEANTWGAYRVLADFTLGAILADCMIKCPVEIRSRLVPWSVFGLAIALMLIGVSSGYLSIAVLAFSIYLAGCYDMANPKTGPVTNALLPLANTSFGIYLWHPVMGVLMLGVVWMRGFEGTGLVPFWVVMVAAMVGSILVAWISAVWVENPMRKAILGLASSDVQRPNKNTQSLVKTPAE